jgi:hypothetical protein
LPRAGKSSFCDYLEKSGAGFTHISLDRYIRPVPAGLTFLQWVAAPSCIAWDHLASHLDILESGKVCYSPRQDQTPQFNWISEGGAIPNGPGRRMEPAVEGYLLAGCHAWALPFDTALRLRAFVQTPLQVIADRFEGSPVERSRVPEVLDRYIAAAEPILKQEALSNVILDGTAPRENQVAVFLDAYMRTA